MGHSFKQILEPVVAVIRHTALPAEEVVVGWNELAEGHATLRLLLQEVDHLSTELVQLLAQQWTCTQPRVFCNRNDIFR